MKNAYFLTLMFPLCVFSCGVNGSDDSKSTLESTVYKIDLNADKVDFLSQIAAISIFGFEETEHSLLNPSSFFFNYENGVIVVDEVSGTVYLFDLEGRYLRKFNRMGRGPEEYQSMQNTVYRDDLIETYDVRGKKVKQYDLEGNFLSELKLPDETNHALFNDERYLLSVGNELKIDSTSHKIIFLDLEGKEYAQALPYNIPPPFPMRTNINDFAIAGEQLLYAALLTDSVVMIDGTDVKPFIRFDFGEDWFWTDEMYADGEAMAALYNVSKVWIYTWVLGPGRIEMTYSISFSEVRKGYVDRSTGQFYHYKFNAWGDEIPDIKSVRYEEDELLTIITPDVLDVFKSELGEGKYKVRGGVSLESIMASENPVMVRIKFK